MKDDCPSIEHLSAYIDQNVTAEEREAIEAHLVECAICRKTVALTIKSQIAAPDPTMPNPAR